MLTYTLEERGGLPLYEYLYRRVRADILSGALAAGERLPSKRALAEHLQISVITVESAYQQLEAEGFLVARPRRGFFVAAVERCLPAHSAPPKPSETSEPVWRLDLKGGQVDVSRFPVSIWAKLTRQVLSEGGEALLAPVHQQGLPALRRAIAANLRNLKGMAVAPEQIVVGAGAVYSKCGVDCRPVPLDGQGVELSALEDSRAGVLHLSPSHHYPTGLVTPIGRRQALLRWAAARDGVIIEDDYDSELRFTGRPLPTLQSIDGGGRVVYVNTFSQTISPSMRVGFMVLPPRLLERYRRELDFYACAVPALEQHVLARFLERGCYEQHLSRMRKEYRSRRAKVLEAFRTSSFAERIAIFEQGAGLHFLLRLDTARSDGELRRRGEELGVRLGFLSECAAVFPPGYAPSLVVKYAGLRAERLPAAVDRLGEVFAEDNERPPPVQPGAVSKVLAIRGRDR